MFPLPRESGQMDVRCAACGKVAIALGKLPKRIGTFYLLNPGELFRCYECGLFFRSTYLSEKELEAAYQTLPDNIWENKEPRTDFGMAIHTLSELFSSGNVLDVGCYCGDLLSMLPDSFRKFGIEPSIKACEKALSRGVEIVGSSVFMMRKDLPMFNCIFMLDVIEHMPNPLQVIERLAAQLKPNGILIISTGNTDSFFWRIARLDYYYYYIEHLTFYNPKWFRWAAKRISMEVISSRRFSRIQSTLFQRIKELALLPAYRLTKYTCKMPGIPMLVDNIYPFNKIAKLSVSPCGSSWSDHLMIVLRKE